MTEVLARNLTRAIPGTASIASTLMMRTTTINSTSENARRDRRGCGWHNVIDQKSTFPIALGNLGLGRTLPPFDGREGSPHEASESFWVQIESGNEVHRHRSLRGFQDLTHVILSTGPHHLIG